jgi:hypothetical protein
MKIESLEMLNNADNITTAILILLLKKDHGWIKKTMNFLDASKIMEGQKNGQK